MIHEAGEPATKGDLTEFQGELRQELGGFRDVRMDVAALGDKLSKLILQMRSDLMGAVESAVIKAGKVDRGH